MSNENFLKDGLINNFKVYLSFIGITEDKLPFDSDKYKFLNEIYTGWIGSLESSLFDKATAYRKLLDELINNL